MNTPRLTLISHALCPYVQRAAIVLAEKGIAFERRDIDLANKPDWFLAVSPLGKTPVLLVDGEAIFESAVICEYLEDTALPRLHPANALQQAWRSALACRPSVAQAVRPDYAESLRRFLRARGTALSGRMSS